MSTIQKTSNHNPNLEKPSFFVTWCLRRLWAKPLLNFFSLVFCSVFFFFFFLSFFLFEGNTTACLEFSGEGPSVEALGYHYLTLAGKELREARAQPPGLCRPSVAFGRRALLIRKGQGRSQNQQRRFMCQKRTSGPPGRYRSQNTLLTHSQEATRSMSFSVARKPRFPEAHQLEPPLASMPCNSTFS